MKLRIIWASMLFWVAIYAALPAVVPAPSDAQPVPLVAPLLAAIGLSTAVASLVIRAVGLVRPVRDGKLDPGSPAGQQRILVLSIVNWALAESIGVFGLVCYLMGTGVVWLYGMAGAAAVLLAIHAPRSFSHATSSMALARKDVKIG